MEPGWCSEYTGWAMVGMIRVRILAGAKDLSHLQNTYTLCETHLAPYSVGAVSKAAGARTTRICVVFGSRLSEVVPPLPLYAFMACMGAPLPLPLP